MTRSFALRELRRQAPIAIGLVVLGVLTSALASLVELVSLDKGGAASGFFIVVLAAPLLLAVASVTPDVESGAASFLARLPFSRRRELAVRWGVAAGLSVATIAVDWLVVGPISGAASFEWAASRWVPLWLVSVGGFAAGLAASVALRRTLTALVAAPALLLIPALAIVGSVGWSTARLEVGSTLAALIVPTLFVAAALGFFRGELHRRSFRPTLLVGATVVSMTALVSGGAFAWDVGAGHTDWRAWSVVGDPSGKHVLICSTRVSGFGEAVLENYVVLAASDLRVERELQEVPVCFSPDGAKLLVVARDGDAKLRLIDLATGAREDRRSWPTVAPVSSTALSVRGPGSSSLFCARQGIAWRSGRPIFADGGVLSPWSKSMAGWPEVARVAAAPLRVESIGGSRLVLVGPDGQRSVRDLERGERVPSLDAVAGEPGVVGAALDPTGTWLVASTPSPAGPVLAFADERGERVHRVLLPRRATDKGTRGPVVTFSGERAVVETFVPTRRWFVDLATGEAREVSSAGSTLLLSPDGRRALSAEGVLDDVETGAVLARDACGFVDAERAITGDGRGLQVLDLRTGARSKLR